MNTVRKRNFAGTMILSAEQIRAWDEYTIQNEPVTSLDLMERAAAACVHWLEDKKYFNKPFSIFCGKGNNGGDGLAIARMLSLKGCEVAVNILEFGHLGTEDFQRNLARLHGMSVTIRFLQTFANFPVIGADEIIIDALLGSGLNRPLEGVTAELVDHLNASGNEIISIDIPTGLFADKSSKGNKVINAHHTLSFQCHKPALLVAENEPYTGEVHVLDIGLHPSFPELSSPAYHWINEDVIRALFRPRKKYSHKGNFGHALLIAGSYGKMGAAVLAAKACLRSGVGLLTVHVPICGLDVLQTAVPEAMCTIDKNERFITHIDDLSPFNAIGIGPGIGKQEETAGMIEVLLQHVNKSMVLDADALNILSSRPDFIRTLHPLSILTPHPKEFERLFGHTQNDFERITLAKQKSKELNVIIVLKGHHSVIATPGGRTWFNSSGNPGMATGGTGDVLTGIITGLMAQGYEPEQAAVFGVYWHGLAGDIASGFYSPETLTASDIPEALGAALQKILSSGTQQR
ncbi:MAG TPA: NAD(P)H-hydrate dehydratase [Chitinophagaceae bacterium]